jgi:hypothetical protein
MPFYADIDEIQDDLSAITPGFTLMTQNNLSTLVSTFGYEYSGQRHKLHSNIKWKGWYPVIESGIEYGNPVNVEKLSDVAVPDILSDGYSGQQDLSSGIQGRTSPGQLYLSASSSIKNDYIYLRETAATTTFRTSCQTNLHLNYRRQSLRILSAWAQTIDDLFDYPFDGSIYGDIFRKAFTVFPRVTEKPWLQAEDGGRETES